MYINGYNPKDESDLGKSEILSKIIKNLNLAIWKIVFTNFIGAPAMTEPG